MKISHRALSTVAPLTVVAEPTADRLPPLGLDKAPRLSCCCRLSELLPLLRQVHDEAARARKQAGEGQQAA